MASIQDSLSFLFTVDAAREALRVGALLVPAAVLQYAVALRVTAIRAGEPWPQLPPPPPSSTQRQSRSQVIACARRAAMRRDCSGKYGPTLVVALFHSATGIPWWPGPWVLAAAIVLGALPLLCPHRLYQAPAGYVVCLYALYLYGTRYLVAMLLPHFDLQPRYVHLYQFFSLFLSILQLLRHPVPSSGVASLLIYLSLRNRSDNFNIVLAMVAALKLAGALWHWLKMACAKRQLRTADFDELALQPCLASANGMITAFCRSLARVEAWLMRSVLWLAAGTSSQTRRGKNRRG